jgi:hypothetical protein
MTAPISVPEIPPLPSVSALQNVISNVPKRPKSNFSLLDIRFEIADLSIHFWRRPVVLPLEKISKSEGSKNDCIFCLLCFIYYCYFIFILFCYLTLIYFSFRFYCSRSCDCNFSYK